MARFSDEAPYKQSRAALRQIYGPRAITYGGQSKLDTTPSGRMKLAQEAGATERQARDIDEQQFRQPFQRTLPAPVLPNPFRRPMTGGFTSTGLGTGTLRTPYGSTSLGLVPQTAPAEDIAPFIPTPAAPLNNFSLPGRTPFSNSLLTPQSPWRRSVYG